MFDKYITNLIDKYTLERCLIAIDNKHDINLYEYDDDCLRDVLHLAAIRYGIRKLKSILEYG